MSSHPVTRPGLAVVCSYSGEVIEVLRDDLQALAQATASPHVACLFDPGSTQQALGLLQQVKEQGASFGWDLTLAVDGQPRTLPFAAAALGDRILLTASLPEPDPELPTGGLSLASQAQLNGLRAAAPGGAGAAAGTAPALELSAARAHDLFRDMVELNNRLVNAERELARKNAELRRLSAVLRKDLHLAHRVLQCSGEAVVVADHRRRVVETNPAFTALTGFTQAEMVGTDLRLCESAGLPDSLVDQIWAQVASTGSWQGECTGRRKSGERFPTWLTLSTVPGDNGGALHYVVNFLDITRLKNAEEGWHRLAFYDSLTHLPNRVLFKDRLLQAIVRARRDQEQLALLFIDLDEFKIVNDSLGHDAGDRLLIIAAQRIQSCVRKADSIARLGGDEFTVIMHGAAGTAEVAGVCDKIIQAVNAPFEISGHSVRIGASIGISRFPADGDDPDTLTKNADTAMYAAKAAGRNTHRAFSQALGEGISHLLRVKSQIAQGLQRGEFRVELQPLVDLASGRVQSLEALLRWDHPERGCLLPDQFIPVAEESGLIAELGEFVIRQACRLAQELRASGWLQARVAVNVSRRQLAAPGLVEFITSELGRCSLPGTALIVEVTESMVMGNLEHAVEVLNKLREVGVSAAIDDFGTGYSSLNALRRLPVEYLKIDKSFIADADISPESESIMGAIIAMAHGLGLKTVAEGVERQAQRDLLRQVGCDTAQGYWFARPQTLEALRPLLGAGLLNLRPPGAAQPEEV